MALLGPLEHVPIEELLAPEQEERQVAPLEHAPMEELLAPQQEEQGPLMEEVTSLDTQICTLEQVKQAQLAPQVKQECQAQSAP